jgi:hypothetical protein
MSDVEGKRAQRDAQSEATAPMTRRRAQVWNGLMRYLSGEAVREQARAAADRGWDPEPGSPKGKAPRD